MGVTAVRSRALFALATLLLPMGLAIGSPTRAATLTVQSQEGSVDASGVTIETAFSSDSVPISGTADVDVQASVADSGATLSYAASAALQTTLAADQIQIAASTSAIVTPVQCGFDAECSASAHAHVTLVVDLDEAAVALFDWAYDPGTNNGPFVSLTSLDHGFSVHYDYFGGEYVDGCGSLSTAECNALPEIFARLGGSGATLPAGSYEIVFGIDAGNVSGSCSVGCVDAAGSATLSLVPPPSCEESLALCEGDLNVCETDLALCEATPLFTDADGDGEFDGTDACPGTPAGQPVDQAGCSIAQFCASVDLSQSSNTRPCKLADWGNDEPLGADDCQAPQGGGCIPQ